MLGHYENFPKTIHGIVRFTYKASPKKVQQAIAATFYRLNQEKRKLVEIAHSSPPNCEIDFEFGIGGDSIFTFLNKEELATLEGEITRKAVMFMDFLCVLQYHIVNESGKRSPLKFDYYLLRFAFGKNYMEFLVSHERGPQRVHVEDLIDFLTKHVKSELADRFSAVLRREGAWTI